MTLLLRQMFWITILLVWQVTSVAFTEREGSKDVLLNAAERCLRTSNYFTLAPLRLGRRTSRAERQRFGA
jgi:hypothetical protein